MTVEMEKAPRGGALCAKAQSDSVVASVYFTTCKSSGPIHPTQQLRAASAGFKFLMHYQSNIPKTR